MKNVIWENNYSVYVNYLEKTKNVDFDWNSNIRFKVNKNTPLGQILTSHDYTIPPKKKDNIPKIINTIKVILNRIKQIPNYD